MPDDLRFIEDYPPIEAISAEAAREKSVRKSQHPAQPIADRIGAPWIALVAVLRRIQKIAYFATQSGIPTGLHFQRGSFGPYARDLKRRVTALVNNGLLQERRLGRMFAVGVGQTYQDALSAYQEQLEHWRPAIEKVADLFMRMRTDQAEIAATVHFATSELKQQSADPPAEMAVLRTVMEWKQKRWPPLNEKEVALSIRSLNILSWLGAKASTDLPVSEEEFLQV